MMNTQAQHNAAPAPLLELRGISKSFPGVKALSDVALRLYPGEVHTLMAVSYTHLTLPTKA